MMLIGELRPAQGLPEALSTLPPLRHAFIAQEDRSCIDAVAEALRDGQFYQALRRLGQLRKREAALLAGCLP